jgi:tetratricopeptide (TPR) repeat protein
VENIDFQDNIVIDKRRFKIHSEFQPDTKIAASEVFEQDNFLFKVERSHSFKTIHNLNDNIQFLKDETQKNHRETIEELELLFNVHQRLKKLKDASAHSRLGKVFYSKNIYDMAIDNFEKALELEPSMLISLKFLGAVYIKAEHYTKAKKIFEKALKLNPEYPDILNGIGVVFTKLKKYETAKNFFQKSLRIKPNFSEAQFNLGLLLFLSAFEGSSQNTVIPSRITRSLNEMKKLEMYQNPVWQEKYEQITILIKDKASMELKKQLLEFQNLLTVRENLSVFMDIFFLRFMYGGKELSEDELDRYEALLQANMEMEGKYADFWNEMGVLHLIQSRNYFKKAQYNFDEALKINPNYREALKSKELINSANKGLLILLRAILK